MNSGNNITGLDQIVGTPSKLILICASETDYFDPSQIRLTKLILVMTYDKTSGQLRRLDIGNSTERQIEQAVTGGKGYEGRLPHLHEYSLIEDGLKEYLGCLDLIDEMTQRGITPSRLFESPLKQLMERNHVQIIELDSIGTSITNIPAGYPVEVLSYKDLLKEIPVKHDLNFGAIRNPFSRQQFK